MGGPDLVVSGNTFTVVTGADTRTQFRAVAAGVWVSHDKRPDVGASDDAWVRASLAWPMFTREDVNAWCAHPSCTALEREACRLAWDRVMALREAMEGRR